MKIYRRRFRISVSNRFAATANRTRLSYKIDEVWKHLSGEEVIEKIKHIALGLADLGVKAGDKIAIISENRPEWSLTDLAILSLRAVNVPIYTTQAVEQIRYILEDSGAKMLFISGKKLFKHAEEAIQSVERLEKIIFFDDDSLPENDNRALTLSEIEKRGMKPEKIDSQAFENYLKQIKTDDLGDNYLHFRHDRRTERRDADARKFCFKCRGNFQRFADQNILTVRLRFCHCRIFSSERFFTFFVPTA